MRLIIAGGRHCCLQAKDFDFLNSLAPKIHLVLTGGCRGIDKEGESWAGSWQINVVTFLADWKNEGKKAGPLRNARMAKSADAVVLFSGGKGTESMYQEAKKVGLKIYDRRGKR